MRMSMSKDILSLDWETSIGVTAPLSTSCKCLGCTIGYPILCFGYLFVGWMDGWIEAAASILALLCLASTFAFDSFCDCTIALPVGFGMITCISGNTCTRQGYLHRQEYLHQHGDFN